MKPAPVPLRAEETQQVVFPRPCLGDKPSTPGWGNARCCVTARQLWTRCANRLHAPTRTREMQHAVSPPSNYGRHVPIAPAICRPAQGVACPKKYDAHFASTARRVLRSRRKRKQTHPHPGLGGDPSTPGDHPGLGGDPSTPGWGDLHPTRPRTIHAAPALGP